MAITQLPTGKTKAVFDPRKWTIFIHGQSGVGKSTFISGFRNALILDCDDGHNALTNERVTVRTWDDVESVYNLLAQSASMGKLKYTQIIIDTVTMFSRLAQEKYCADRGINHEAEVDYKGYPAVRGSIMNMITRFRNLGLGVVFVAHSAPYFTDKLKKEKSGPAKWVPKMDDELFSMLDSIATVSMYFQAVDAGDHVERTIHLAPSSLWYAKNRMERDEDGVEILPARLPMDFEAFRGRINDYIQHRNAKAEKAEAPKKVSKKEATKE